MSTEEDGRRARRERGRVAVIDAVFSLLQDGKIPPPVDEVALRSGVSVSSIFRYFDGLDDLQRQTFERFLERFEPLFEIPDLGRGPLDGRIGRFVDARLALFEQVGIILSVARLRSLEHPVLEEAAAGIRLRLAEQVRRQFGPELATATPARAAELVAIVDSLTSPQTWDVMRQTHARSQRQIRKSWRTAIQALIVEWIQEGS